MVTQELGREEVRDNTKPIKEVEQSQSLPRIGRAKPNPIRPSENTVAICKHQEEIVVEDMPQYQFVCERCGKGFTHKKNSAYGRHRISRPMRIVGPIQFWRGCVIYLTKKYIYIIK